MEVEEEKDARKKAQKTIFEEALSVIAVHLLFFSFFVFDPNGF